jgi:hypothetical protein
MTIQARSNGSRAGDNFLALFERIQAHQAANQRHCTAWLIENHAIAAEHPDDGWVDRFENTLLLCYPPFRRDPQVGDMIALGSPTCDAAPAGRYRLVRVTDIRMGLISRTPTYSFEPVGEPFEVPGAAGTTEGQPCETT